MKVNFLLNFGFQEKSYLLKIQIEEILMKKIENYLKAIIWGEIFFEYHFCSLKELATVSAQRQFLRGHKAGWTPQTH